MPDYGKTEYNKRQLFGGGKDHIFQGRDKYGRETYGKTWVSKRLTWIESDEPSQPVFVQTGNIQPDQKGKDPGFIYVMRSAQHPPNVFKVGLTRRNAEERAFELSRGSGVPDRFHVMQRWNTSNCSLAEKKIHERLAHYRLNPDREFFEVSYEEIFSVIHSVLCEVDGKKA